jgi:hypothetical protein
VSSTREDAKIAGNVQKYSTAVQSAAQQWMDRVGVKNLRQDPQSVILSALSDTKLSGDKLGAISKMINENPQARQQFGQSLGYYLSQKSPSAIVEEFNRLKPAIKGSGLMNSEDVAAFEAKVKEVAAASKRMPPAETSRAITQWWNRFKVQAPRRAAGALVGTEAARMVPNQGDEE